MTIIDFRHEMAAHCESGALAAILKHAGLEISEPMTFGIGSGIFFAYMKIPSMHFPVIAVRSRPGDIRKNLIRNLGISFGVKHYSNSAMAEQELDHLLGKGIPVAIQTDMFYMTYIPQYMRVHFNAHFVVVIGRENGVYSVSDCYYPSIATLSAASMEKARFAKGDFSPGGLLVYVNKIPESIDWNKAIRKSIHSAAFGMLRLPVPFVGIAGIRLFSKKISSWPRYARHDDQLSDEIMKINILLEERGTGGGGFRFLYASFLQEASLVLNDNAYSDLARRMMANGDRWRDISLYAARMGRNRDFSDAKFSELSGMIMDRAEEEKILFSELFNLTK
jgi:hypothetical protein